MITFFVIFMNQGSTKIPLTVEKIFDTPFDQKFIEGDVIEVYEIREVKRKLELN